MPHGHRLGGAGAKECMAILSPRAECRQVSADRDEHEQSAPSPQQTMPRGGERITVRVNATHLRAVRTTSRRIRTADRARVEHGRGQRY
jgi:hypothetical protein